MLNGRDGRFLLWGRIVVLGKTIKGSMDTASVRRLRAGEAERGKEGGNAPFGPLEGVK